MIFIGVVSEHQKFEILKRIIQRSGNKIEITLINLNKQSIENMKNVKFDSIMILNGIEDFQIHLKNLKYLIINSDLEIKKQILENVKTNIITFGLNQKSTVTFSSITDENLLISVQRNFKNNNNNIIEVGEYNAQIYENEREYLSEILAGFIIEKLYIKR